jgi:hypothetical protein
MVSDTKDGSPKGCSPATPDSSPIPETQAINIKKTAIPTYFILVLTLGGTAAALSSRFKTLPDGIRGCNAKSPEKEKP